MISEDKQKRYKTKQVTKPNLVAMATLLLPAVNCPWVKTSITPDCRGEITLESSRTCKYRGIKIRQQTTLTNQTN